MRQGSDILARPGNQLCRKRGNPSSLRGHSSTPSSKGCHLALPASTIVPKTQWNLIRDLGTLRAGFTETTAGDWQVCPLWTHQPVPAHEHTSGFVGHGRIGGRVLTRARLQSPDEHSVPGLTAAARASARDLGGTPRSWRACRWAGRTSLPSPAIGSIDPCNGRSSRRRPSSGSACRPG